MSTPGAPATIRHTDRRRGLGGPEAAAVIERIYADVTEDNQAEFNRICYPLYSSTPGWAEESRRFQARMIKSPDVSLHYSSHEVASFDPWSVLDAVRCPVLPAIPRESPAR